MLGVFSTIGTLLGAIYNVYASICFSVSQLWVFFELYGWRLLIGVIAGGHFMLRILEESERREKHWRARAVAEDTSRNTALNERREVTIQRIGQTHQETVERKKGRDDELRRERIRELEKKVGGSGHRLGSASEQAH